MVCESLAQAWYCLIVVQDVGNGYVLIKELHPLLLPVSLFMMLSAFLVGLKDAISDEWQ